MKSVQIAELKNHLSQHLRAVEAGEQVIVTDRRRPIARIVPASPLTATVVLVPPRRDFVSVRDRHRPCVDLGITSTSLLLEERGDR
jgi:prevent-host-death family protein